MPERGEIQDVNIGLGDDVSRMLYEASKVSWENRPGVVVEMHPSFSGWRAITPGYKPIDCYEGMGSDGIGTKVEVAERLEDWSTAADNLFAMASDDAVVRGAEPIAINTVLDVNQLVEDDVLTENAIRQLAQGYVRAARLAGVVILNGETAELGDRVGGYGSFNLNWSGTVLWYAHPDRVLTGHQIHPGDTLVGLAEHGFRSNGITDVRRAMLEHYGDNWQHQVVEDLGSLSLGRLVETPSTIYSRFVTSLTGGFDINREPKAEVSGVAHITGGGQPSKLGRMLESSGLGVTIDRPLEPPKAMLHVQELRGFTDEKAYGKWHMGSGMIIATSEPEKVLTEAEEQGLDAQEIGLVTDEPGIRIRNHGAVQDEEWLNF
ncbi:MAG TPA: AIR synthase-related protein [Candidatus Sulfotelmatobacter sp.]|nr:AIR synthase-related protein [Candidatus Sulfotelmatobacter sp.]